MSCDVYSLHDASPKYTSQWDQIRDSASPLLSSNGMGLTRGASSDASAEPRLTACTYSIRPGHDDHDTPQAGLRINHGTGRSEQKRGNQTHPQESLKLTCNVSTPPYIPRASTFTTLGCSRLNTAFGRLVSKFMYCSRIFCCLTSACRERVHARS